MSYLVFLIVLASAGLLWLIGRVFRLSIAFESIFTALTTALVMLPVYVLSLMVMAIVVLAIFFGMVLILYLTGLLPYIAPWPVWHAIPWWLWLTTGVAGLLAAMIAQDVRQKRALPAPLPIDEET
jgi:hypothetical protein